MESMDDRSLTFPVTIRSQGRITIPDEVRRALGVVEGDLIYITVRKFRKREPSRPEGP